MSDEPLDLSALDPASDPARLRRMMNSITAGAARALAERRRAVTVVSQLSGWTRSIFAAAAVVSLASASILFFSGQTNGSSEAANATTASAPDLGSAAILWAADGRAPTIGELLDIVGSHGYGENGKTGQ
jgi:hypothetical protein